MAITQREKKKKSKYIFFKGTLFCIGAVKLLLSHRGVGKKLDEPNSEMATNFEENQKHACPNC